MKFTKMKPSVFTINLLLLAFLTFSVSELYGTNCPNCPTSTNVQEFNGSLNQLAMIFGDDAIVEDIEEITVFDAAGELCGTFNTEYLGSYDNVLYINMPIECPELSNSQFTGTLLINGTECVVVGDAPEDCSTVCTDCPTEFTYIPEHNVLEVTFLGGPSWSWNSAPAVYYVENGQTYGPLGMTINSSTTNYETWWIWNFPNPQQVPAITGSLIFEGVLECQYDLEEVLIGCEPFNPGNCNCPYISNYINAQGDHSINMGFDYWLPFPHGSPVTATLNWGQNTTGPYNVTWYSSSQTNPAWYYYLNDGAPTPFPISNFPFTGELNLNNGAMICQYVNGVAISCDDDLPPFGDEVGCEKLNFCEDELEDFAQNLPGSGCAKWETDCNTYAPIHRYGNVSIGIDGMAPQYSNKTPNGYNLSVTYGIMTDFIKVELCGTGGWCDYVFEDDYQLMPLHEVKDFVAENKHLPNTVSEKEIIDQGGIQVRETLLDQQEKIEELFLHLIDMNKKIKETEEEIKYLEIENNILRVVNNF